MNALKLHFFKTILKTTQLILQLTVSLYNRFLDRKQTFHVSLKVSVGRDLMFMVGL